MTITEHKRLIAQTPEDLREGDAIEGSCDGDSWTDDIFAGYRDCDDFLLIRGRGGELFAYARRKEQQ